MPDIAPNAALTAAPAAPAYAGGRVALLLLTAIGTVNFIDRQLLSVLVEPIRAELHFSDTMFGLLSGLCFALFYATLGIPAAMLADRTNRVRLVACACAVWSVFTGACGLATNFWHLALMRFGVGVGEAGGTAPSLSILADYYPPEQRPAVIGLYTVNGPIGVFLGASLGGWAAGQFGWRAAFFLIATIGLALAPLLWLFVREPVRGATERRAPSAVVAEPAPTFASTVALFLRLPTLTLLVIASGVSAFASYGMLNWIPAFLMRERGMPLADLARWFGPAAGLCMGLGIWGGGAIVNIAGRKSAAAYAWAPAIAMLIAAPTFAAALLAPTWQLSLALMLVPMVSVMIYVAPALALVQNLAPLRSRATATAMLLLGFNIVGLGGGPLVIGMISDALNAAGVAHNLQWGLMGAALACLFAALAYAIMARHIVDDTETARRENAA